MTITSSKATAAGICTTVVDVGGVPTELLEIDAVGTASPDVQLLIIPGNPGAAPFYVDFMQHLAQLMGGRAAVATVSNLGMAADLNPAGQVYDLAQQVDHKVALLQQRFTGPGRPPLVILAHSIGAYMAIHATHRLDLGDCTGAAVAPAPNARMTAASEWDWPDAAAPPPSLITGDSQAAAMGMQQAAEGETRRQRDVAQQQSATQQQNSREQGSGIIKVIALYPFLQVDPSCTRQRRLAWLTRHHALVARLAGGLGLLPVGVRRGLVRLLGGAMDAHAVDTVADVFASRDCVANGLFMGCSEFQLLAAPADWWLLQWLGSRFAVFVAPNDVWFKEWKWQEMHRQVPDVESYLVETQTHAFCVSTEQSRDLAARIVPIVEAALASSGSRLRSWAA
ncbi:hypothetical protein D9Q98_003330 [Chlorella vulgaris]|uniref:Uncharacterized protein n=1 Tax=Chlorella vulgaris TaxID=3077 RepID=A0A9D4YZB9_CHLVU|nr:hypothetical protein D9Q98_003330 [Chlorella vulgaris]